MPFDGGSDTVETKNTSAPWKPQQGPLMRGFDTAGGLLGSSTRVAPSAYYTGGRNALYSAGIAAGQTPNMGPMGANPYYQSVMGGDYLNSNPYLDQMYDQAAGRYRGQVNANASGAGRYGSALHQDTLQQGLGELATNVYAQNYQQERARQQEAAAGLSQNELGAYQAQLAGQQQRLQGAGAAYGVGQDYQRYLEAQKMEPWQRASNYMNLIGGNYGQTSVQQNPYFQPSPFSQIAGLGLGAAGLFG